MPDCTRLEALKRRRQTLASSLRIKGHELRTVARQQMIASADLARLEEREEVERKSALHDFEQDMCPSGVIRWRRIERLDRRKAHLASCLERAAPRLEGLTTEISRLEAELDEVRELIIEEHVRLMLAPLDTEAAADFPEVAEVTVQPTAAELQLLAEAAQEAEKRMKREGERLQAAREESSCQAEEAAQAAGHLQRLHEGMDRREGSFSQEKAAFAKTQREVAEQADRAKEAMDAARELQEELGNPSRLVTWLREVLQQQPAELERLGTETERLVSELSQGNKDMEVLRARLKTTQDDAKTLEQARHSLQEEVARAEGPARQTAEEVQELENRLVLVRARREKLEAEMTEMRDALSREETAAREIEAENARLDEARRLVEANNERLRAEAEMIRTTSENAKARKLAAQLLGALE